MADRPVDYVLDCADCGQMYVYATREEREAEMASHANHDFDYFLQARI